MYSNDNSLISINANSYLNSNNVKVIWIVIRVIVIWIVILVIVIW